MRTKAVGAWTGSGLLRTWPRDTAAPVSPLPPGTLGTRAA